MEYHKIEFLINFFLLIQLVTHSYRQVKSEQKLISIFTLRVN